MNSFLQSMKALGPMRLAAMGAVGLVLIGFFVYLTLRMATPPMALLYSDLSLQDSDKIVTELEAQNIAYRLENGGATIMVPKDQVNRQRIHAAEMGMPTGGSMGYELFDDGGSMGNTSFVQNVNLTRALEGELSRTIQSIDGVKTARVHLVLPQRELFTRDRQPPSASIMLTMDNNATPDRQEVQAIQQLVAASVPRLDSDRVAVVDSRGELLSDEVGDGAGKLLARADERKRAIEQRLRRAVEALLAQSVGYDNVRTQVSVEMDLNRVQTTEENYNPDQRVVRSTQAVEEDRQSTDTGLNEVSVQENLPDQQQADEEPPTSRSSEQRTEETTNYEISRTVRNLVREAGVMKRLSVAVLVNGITATDANGNQTYQPRNAEEMEKLTSLVQSAVGYDPARGDSVEVINMRFAPVETAAGPDKDTILGFEKDEVLRIAEILVLSLVALLVILLVVRPLVSRAFESMPQSGDAGLLTDQRSMTPALTGPSAPGMLEEEELEDELIDLERVEGRVKASSIKKIGDIVSAHPEEALSILRNWMYQDQQT